MTKERLLAAFLEVEQEQEATQADLTNLLKEVAGLLKEVKAMEEERIEERLLNVKEVAKILGCSPVTVSMRMTRGEIVWRLEKGSSTRKVAYSDLVDYMRELPTYTGALAPVLSKLRKEKENEVDQNFGQRCDVYLVETLNASERFSRPERAFSLRFAAFVPLA